ncbi:E3 ubiquitin-protein ligase E3D [Dispira parvispora]|uniref:E3 ubiquitin-protein ligase E3D n=1 Tax=Dispira parvispora TaxID=1520584 RepID=A0A9W8AMY3_9FUNG|nr:E3 ubiquitin-protein ligase E3D [Dispira parvispora]
MSDNALYLVEVLSHLRKLVIHYSPAICPPEHTHQQLTFTKERFAITTISSSSSTAERVNHAQGDIDLGLPVPILPTPYRIQPVTSGQTPTNPPNTLAARRLVYQFHTVDTNASTSSGLNGGSRDIQALLATMEPPLGARELSRVTELACRWCGSTFIRSNCTNSNTSPPSYFSTLDLPSEHWTELLDCWMCHPDEETQFIMQYDRDVSQPGVRIHPWNPKSNQILVGHTYVLLSESDVVPDGLISKDQVPLKSTSGSSSATTDLRVPVRDTQAKFMFLIHKAAVEFHTRNQDLTSEILAPPSTHFLAADLIEHGKAHANYRYVLYGQDRKNPLALLWLLHWDTALATNLFKTLPHSKGLRLIDQVLDRLGMLASDTQKVLKVCYKEAHRDQEAFQSQALKWSHRNDVEPLYYTDEQCLEIITLLRLTTFGFPPEIQQFQGFSVGWVPIT